MLLFEKKPKSVDLIVAFVEIFFSRAKSVTAINLLVISFSTGVDCGLSKYDKAFCVLVIDNYRNTQKQERAQQTINSFDKHYR